MMHKPSLRRLLLWPALKGVSAPLRRRARLRRHQAIHDRKASIRRMEAHRATWPERTRMVSLAELRQSGVIQ